MNKAIFLLGVLLVLGCNEDNSLESTNENLPPKETQDSLTTETNEIPFIISGADKDASAILNCTTGKINWVKNVKDSLFSVSKEVQEDDCQVIVLFGQPTYAISRPTSFTLGNDTLVKVQQVLVDSVKYEKPELGWVSITDTLLVTEEGSTAFPTTIVDYTYLISHLVSAEEEGLEYFHTGVHRRFYTEIDSNVYEVTDVSGTRSPHYILDHQEKKSYQFEREWSDFLDFEIQEANYNTLKERKPVAITDSLRNSFQPAYRYTILGPEGDTLHQVSGTTFGQDLQTTFKGAPMPTFCSGEYPEIELLLPEKATLTVAPHEENHFCVGEFVLSTGETVYFQLPRFKNFRTVTS